MQLRYTEMTQYIKIHWDIEIAHVWDRPFLLSQCDSSLAWHDHVASSGSPRPAVLSIAGNNCWRRWQDLKHWNDHYIEDRPANTKNIPIYINWKIEHRRCGCKLMKIGMPRAIIVTLHATPPCWPFPPSSAAEPHSLVQETSNVRWGHRKSQGLDLEWLGLS